MADTEDKIKDTIDDAAQKAKEATDKAVVATKDAAYNGGKKVERTGEDLKDAGKSARKPAATSRGVVAMS